MSPEKSIFIIGVPRSGTTILAQAMAAHPQMGWISNYCGRFPRLPQLSALNVLGKKFTAGEPACKHPPTMTSFERSFRKLRPKIDEAYKIWERWCGKEFSYSYLTGQKAGRREKKAIRSCMETILRFQKKRILLAKLTGPARIQYVNSIFPPTFFIHIIRDPRAVVASLMHVSFWQKKGGLKWPWWTEGLTVEDMRKWEKSGSCPWVLAAVQWRRIIENARQEKNQLHASQYVEIRYEDFVMNPAGILSRLFDYFNLEKINVTCVSTLIKKDLNRKYLQVLKGAQLARVNECVWETALKCGYRL